MIIATGNLSENLLEALEKNMYCFIVLRKSFRSKISSSTPATYESRIREAFFISAIRRELARVAVKKVGLIESRPHKARK